MPRTPPARLFFILARNAPVGVIFRRGPNKWVQILKWNTAADSFEPGQWFHGRIYERRCDLSPDGTKLIYFAQQITDRTVESESTYAWTAISKLPYLTALALWPNGSCWNGGGLFETDSQVWLNHPPDTQPMEGHRPPEKLKVTAVIHERGEDGTVLERRLDRDGWVVVKQWRGERTLSVGKTFVERIADVRPSDVDWLRPLHESVKGWGYVTFGPQVREKKSPDSGFSLIMSWTLIGLEDSVRFALRDMSTGEQVPLDEAEWADWDQSGRLVYVNGGKVYAATVDGSAITAHELIDLNGNKFEPTTAPDWATRW